MERKIVLLPLILLLGVNFAYAEELPITLSTNLEDVIFDGKWSYQTEWKPSSLTRVESENSNFVIRYAHDYENLLILISVVSDTTPSRISDKALVCIDSKNDGGNMPQVDDFCFMAKVGSNTPITLQGGGFNAFQGYYKKIENHPDLIAVGGISGEWDRYSKVPHSSYEFKIPLEIIGKSNSYGFFVAVHDPDSGNYFGWPTDAKLEKYPFIPIPEKWGQLVSPDKSIPEFDLPFLILLLAIAFVVLISNLFSKKISSLNFTHL